MSRISPSPRYLRYVHDGLAFDVVDTGPLDGEIVVLLHGFPQRAHHWDEVAGHLHAAGYRTVAPDQRGYSPGARPRGRAAYRMSKLVGDVVALISSYDGPVHLVGHDWGAAIAWTTAAQHPERVRTLTTVSVPHPAAFVRSLLSLEQLRHSWYIGLFQIPGAPGLIRHQQRLLGKRLVQAGMTEDEAARVWRDVVEYGALAPALNWYRAMPLTTPSAVLTPVRVPTTHVWSDGDAALGRRGFELAGRYVDAPFESRVIAGASHWLPEQRPRELAEVILERIRG